MLDTLLRGTAAFLHIPRFLDPAWSGELARRFLDPQSGRQERDYSVVRPLELGMMLASMTRQRRNYFSQVPSASLSVRALYRGGEDPYVKLRHQLQSIDWRIAEVFEDGKAYLSDFVWGFPPDSTIILHHDDQDETWDGLAVCAFPIRLGWNVYLSTPEKGGEFRIYRRKFEPQDHEFRHSHGFRPEVTRGSSRADCRPEAGDLILFDATHYHEVTRIRGQRYRIAAHSLIGLDPSRRTAAFWI